MSDTQTDAQPQGADAQPEGDALDELQNALGADEGQRAEPQEWQPPTRGQYEELVKAREAAEGKLKRARSQAQRLRQGTKDTSGQQAPDGEGQPAGPDPETEKWRRAAIQQSAESALLKRGGDPEMVDLALGQLRISDIEVDERGRPDLEDWLDEMEERYPKLFAKGSATATAVRTPVGSVDQGRAAARPAAQQLVGIGAQIIAKSEAARAVQMRRR